ncbi:MAG: TIGR01777 family oxidoreductase [Myxococcota bacterium]
MQHFERRVALACTAEEAFRWHARPGAFERLTPPWEPVTLTAPAAIEEGVRAHLKLHLGPAYLTWTARHCDIVPGRMFVDEQERGPFRHWRHEHRFHDDKEAGGCQLTDAIDYELPLSPLSDLVAGRAVRAKLVRMFRYRHEVTVRDLEQHQRLSTSARRIGVTGASGLVGSALLPYLTTGGHEVRRLSRRPTRADLEGLDAVVHLAGEPLMGLRWTAEKKRRILESRREGTLHLAETLAAMTGGPRVLVSMSGINHYGDRGDETLTEESQRGSGFLSDVTAAWEESTRPAEAAGLRVVRLRTGVVLSGAGGALPLLALPFRLGVGGTLGRSEAWFSAIAIDDLLDVILRAIVDDELAGPVNAVGPAPVTQGELARMLGKILRRPSLLPVPPLALRAALGSEMAGEMLLSSMRVMPERLQRRGHVFRYDTVEAALRHALGSTA